MSSSQQTRKTWSDRILGDLDCSQIGGCEFGICACPSKCRLPRGHVILPHANGNQEAADRDIGEISLFSEPPSMPTLEKNPGTPKSSGSSHTLPADISSARLVAIRTARGSSPTFISVIDHNLEIGLKLFMGLTLFDPLHSI